MSSKRKHKKRKGPTLRRDAQGRAHLVVHYDSACGAARVALARAVFEHEWQNQVAVGAASTAHALLGAGVTREAVGALARNAMSATSRLVQGLYERSPEAGPACASGCAHCCYQAVGVSVPEVLAIYDYLQGRLAPAELAELREHIQRADERTRGLSSSERFSPELPCPFLVAERCSIYEVRPLACRGKNSLDAAACESTLREPGARAELLAGKRSVPCYLEPIRAFHAVAAGVQLALSELYGLSMQPLELTAAVRILLEDPEGVTARWLAGEDPFAKARGGDASHNPSVASLSGRVTP